MARQRVSTTVDEALLRQARDTGGWSTDAKLFDAALEALLACYRAAEVDAAYAAYDDQPLGEADAWGDLESFRRSVAER